MGHKQFHVARRGVVTRVTRLEKITRMIGLNMVQKTLPRFPKSGKKNVFDLLCEKFKEAKRRYLSLQNQAVEKRPDFKAL